MARPVGTWRSLVAYLNGVQGVPGSNPGVPTNFPEQKGVEGLVEGFVLRVTSAVSSMKAR